MYLIKRMELINRLRMPPGHPASKLLRFSVTVIRSFAVTMFLFLSILFCKNAAAQSTGPHSMFRIYEDDDFLNITGNGTDNAYTNGLRFDLFYIKQKPSRFFIDHLMPKAGSSSINVFGWNVTQLMFTPNN